MQTITLEVQEGVSEKFMWLLSHFKQDEVAIIDHKRLEFLEDISDLKILAKTRDEESVPFEDYLKNAH